MTKAVNNFLFHHEDCQDSSELIKRVKELEIRVKELETGERMTLKQYQEELSKKGQELVRMWKRDDDNTK